MHSLKRILFFLTAFTYVMSRIVLISPDAIEQKTKRVVYFQDRYVAINSDIKKRVAATVSIIKKVLHTDRSKKDFSRRYATLSDNKSGFHFFYQGQKIPATPEDPYHS